MRAIPTRFERAALGDFPEEMSRDWDEALNGAGLLLAGPLGVGKTHALYALAREVEGAMVASAVEWIGDFRADAAQKRPPTFGHERVRYNPASPPNQRDVIERARSAPLVLIDDLGAHRATDYAEEQLYDLIDSRVNNELPLVVSTNHTFDEMRQRNPRVADRLRYLKPFLMVGESRRRYEDGDEQDRGPDPR